MISGYNIFSIEIKDCLNQEFTEKVLADQEKNKDNPNPTTDQVDQKSQRIVYLSRALSEKWGAIPKDIKALYGKLGAAISQEQDRLKAEGNPYVINLSKANRGENKDQRNKELLEYFKRKVGFPLNLLDPAYDNVVPSFIPAEKTPENDKVLLFMES